MEFKTLFERYPLLYHMAEDGSWRSIEQNGLLSTSALLDLYEVNGQKRYAIESMHRPELIELNRAGLPRAVIRDQKPMSDDALVKCLPKSLQPRDWYRILNRKTFFWLTEERLVTLLNARAYRNRSHLVLVAETKSIVQAHLPRITLSPMNSGCTKPRPHPRGPDTFLPIRDYPFAERRHRGKDAIVELAVEGGISDIAKHTVAVRRMRGAEVLEIIR